MDIFDLLHLLVAIFYAGVVAIVVLGAIALFYAIWPPERREGDVEVLSRLDAEGEEQVVNPPVPGRDGIEDVDSHLLEQRRN